MTLEEQLHSLREVFNACTRCNRTILAALEAGQAPEALADHFQHKNALLRQLEALNPLPSGATASESLASAMDGLAQAQAEAIRSEASLSAALLPQIPYHGKRLNPYQQSGPAPSKNALETEG
ncbi:MAG TPA: hypothetical protein VNZ67_04525 [bacterium]|jgi:hypothetical protein|nr:hypothetical protein [bacterium]